MSRADTLGHLAIYVPHIDPQPAGLGVYVDAVCGRLTRRAREVTLFTEAPEHVPTGWRVSRVVDIPSAQFEPGAVRLLARQSWLQAVMPMELVRCEADALFVPFHDGCLLPPCPQFVVVHDLTPLTIPSPYFHPLLRAHLRYLLPRIMARSAAVFAVSDNTRLDIRRILAASADNIHVVGEGFDKSLFKPPPPSLIRSTCARFKLKRPFLLYAGTYAAHKNVELLVRVLAGLCEQDIDVELALCGRPDAGNLPSIRSALDALGLEHRVRLLGYVDRADLPALMHAAAAFLYPSLYEGFGLAPLEAMAAGAVVVATTAASVPEVVGDGGVLLPPADADAWIATVGRLLNDKVESARLRQAAVNRARRFDWDVAVDQMASIMSQQLRAAPGMPRRPIGGRMENER